MNSREKFLITCKYLLGVEPSENVCDENAEIFVKIIENRFKDKSESFFKFCQEQQLAIEERSKDRRSPAVSYSNIKHFSGFDGNLTTNEIMALLNMSTLSLSCMRELLEVEEKRHKAYTHFSIRHIPDSYGNPIIVEHFLCGTIYNSESLRLTLDMAAPFMVDKS